MKTDAQVLQDVMADLQRTAAAQTKPGGGKVWGMKIRVTLSDSGNHPDPDAVEPAGNIAVRASSPAADVCAAPSADRAAPNQASTASASRFRRSSLTTLRPLRRQRPRHTASR
jgi:hypothetical protein